MLASKAPLRRKGLPNLGDEHWLHTTLMRHRLALILRWNEQQNQALRRVLRGELIWLPLRNQKY